MPRREPWKRRSPLHQHLLPKGERRQQHLWLHLHQLEKLLWQNCMLAFCRAATNCFSRNPRNLSLCLLEKKDMTKHIFLYLLLLHQAQHCQFKAKAFGLTQFCTLLSEEGMLLVTWSLLSARQVTKALCLPDSKEKIGSRLKCPLCNGKTCEGWA